MGKGRRFIRFWIYLFVASSTGCAGCFNFGFDTGSSGGGGCNAGTCDGGDCLSFDDDGSPGYDASPPSDRFTIAQNLVNPAGIVSDGTNVFYIDGETLFAASRNGDSPTPIEIADGVRPVSGLALDDTYIYWASAASVEDGGIDEDAGDADAGDADAGDDADSDAGDDAGEDAGTLPTRGIFRVLKTGGGSIEFLGDLDPLPGIALADGNLFLQSRGDDGGILGLLAIDGDAGFQPLHAISGSSTTRSIAPFGAGVAYLDRPDIDFSDLADGGNSTLASEVNASALVAISGAAVYVAPSDAGSVLESTSADSGAAISFVIGDISAYGNYVYLADDSDGYLYRFDFANPADILTVEYDGVPIRMLAADAAGVCWIEGAPARTLFCSNDP